MITRCQVGSGSFASIADVMIFPLYCRPLPELPTGFYTVPKMCLRDVPVQTPWSWSSCSLSLASKTTVFRPQDRDALGGGDARHKAHADIVRSRVFVQYAHIASQLIAMQEHTYIIELMMGGTFRLRFYTSRPHLLRQYTQRAISTPGT